MNISLFHLGKNNPTTNLRKAPLLLQLFCSIIMYLVPNPGYAIFCNPGGDGDGITLQPGVMWSSTIKAKEVDFIKIIDEDRVLIGTLDFGTFLWEKQYKHVIMLNSKTGQKLWDVDRKKFYNKQQFILCTQPVILFQSSNDDNSKMKYSAIDTESGAMLWEREMKTKKVSSSYNPLKDELIIFETDGDRFDIIFLDIKNGNVTGNLSVDTDKKLKKQNPRLNLLYDKLLVILDRKIYCIDLDSRKLLWDKLYDFEDENAIPKIFLLDDILIFYTRNNLKKIDTHTGELLWALSPEGELKIVTVFDKHLYLVTESPFNSENLTVIECYDLSNYTKIWSTKMNGELFSPMVSDVLLLYFTTVTDLISLDKLNGNVIYKAKIPSALCSGEQLFDNIEIDSSKIVICRETGGCCF